MDKDGNGTTVLKIYYLGLPYQLDFVLGTQDEDADTNNDAKLKIADPSGEYGAGATLSLPANSDVSRPGYKLVGWYRPNEGSEAANKAEGDRVASLGGSAANAWYAHRPGTTGSTYTGTFYAAGTNPWIMPGEDVTLYAVWQAEEVTFDVEVWVVPADGSAAIDKTSVYGPKGGSKGLVAYAGDQVIYAEKDAAAPATLTVKPTGPVWSDGTTRTAFGAGYAVGNVWGYRFSYAKSVVDGKVAGIATAATSAAGKLVIKLFYVTDAEPAPGTDNPPVDPVDKGENTFYVVRYTVPVDSKDRTKLGTPVFKDITKHNADAGSWVKADGGADQKKAGTKDDPHLFDDAKDDITGYYYKYDFVMGTLATVFKDRVTGHAPATGDVKALADVPKGALVLYLYYVPEYYDLTLDLHEGTWESPATDTLTGKYPMDWTITLPTGSEVTREGYKLVGWADYDNGSATPAPHTYYIDAETATAKGASVETSFKMPARNVKLEAVWVATPVKFVVEHWRITADGKKELVRTDEYQKFAGTTASVGEEGSLSNPDAYYYVGDSTGTWDGGEPKPGKVATNRYGTEDKLYKGHTGKFPGDPGNKKLLADDTLKENGLLEAEFWAGYRHVGNGTYFGVVVNDSLESDNVLGNGKTKLKVYYAASLVEYTVKRYKVTGDGDVVALDVPETKHLGYVDNAAVADKNRVSATAGWTPAANTHYTADDSALVGYSYYKDDNGAAGPTFTFNRKSYTSVPSTAHIKGDGSTVLTLYYKPDTHTLTLHLDPSGDYGTFSGTPSAPKAVSKSSTSTTVTYTYYTDQTVDALPADKPDGVGKHYHPTGAPNPYRAGYELRGWSTRKEGVATKGKNSVTVADQLDDDPAINSGDPVPWFQADGTSFKMLGQDIDLYAVWAADKITIKLVPGGTDKKEGWWTSSAPSEFSSTTGIEYYVGDPLNDQTDPVKMYMLPGKTMVERRDYKLIGWSTIDQRSYSVAGKGKAAGKTFTGAKGMASHWTADTLEALGDYQGDPQFYKPFDLGTTTAYTLTAPTHNVTLYAVWRALPVIANVYYWKLTVDADGKYTGAALAQDDQVQNSEYSFADETVPYTYYTTDGLASYEVKATDRTYKGFELVPAGTVINLENDFRPQSWSATMGYPSSLNMTDGLTVSTVTSVFNKPGMNGRIRLDLFYKPKMTKYDIEHWIIDGNGKRELVVTTEADWYTGSASPDFEDLTDSRLYPKNTKSDGTGTKINWKGYTPQVITTAANNHKFFDYIDAAGAKTQMESITKDIVVAEDATATPVVERMKLVLIYTADKRTLIYDLGTDIAEFDSPFTYNNDDGTWKYTATETGWTTGKTGTLLNQKQKQLDDGTLVFEADGTTPYLIPKRLGYTFKGWSTEKQGAYTKGSASLNASADIQAGKLKDDATALGLTGNLYTAGGGSFTFPQISDDTLRLYAVWEANTDTQFTVIRYVVTLETDASTGETRAVVREVPTTAGKFALHETGVTDDPIDLARSADLIAKSPLANDFAGGKWNGHNWYSYDDVNGTFVKDNLTYKVPKGYNFIGHGHMATYKNLGVSFDETDFATDLFNLVGFTPSTTQPILTKTDTGNDTTLLPGSGTLVLRVFFVAKPVPVYFNVVDRKGADAGEDGGQWMKAVSYTKDLISDAEPYVPNNPTNTLGTAPDQHYQWGYVYSGQIVKLPSDAGMKGDKGDVFYKGYTLSGWALEDLATTKDDPDTKGGKQNFQIRQDYYDDASQRKVFGVSQESATSANLVYDGIWTVPDDLQDIFDKYGLEANGTNNKNNLWAVYVLRAQQLIFEPAGRGTRDEILAEEEAKKNPDYKDGDPLSYPNPEGEWADNFTPGDTTGPTFGLLYGDHREEGGENEGLSTNLGTVVGNLPFADQVTRPGYKFIGWTSDPNAIGLRSTNWRDGADTVNKKRGTNSYTIRETIDGVEQDVTVYEIDYRFDTDGDGKYDTIQIPEWTMPTELTGPLKFYAVWEQEKIKVEYWGPTDRNGEVEEVVKTVEVYLTDDFDAWWYDASDPLKTHVYDYNRDDDPDNDYMGYKVTGWWNEYYTDVYDPDRIDQCNAAGTPLKWQDIYDEMVINNGWDPNSGPLILFANYEAREITVNFGWGGAPEGPEPTKFSWFDTPSNTKVRYAGYKFTGWTDDWGMEILTPTEDNTAPWSTDETGSYTTMYSNFDGVTAMRQISQHDPFLGLDSYTTGDIVLMMASWGYGFDIRLVDEITINASWEYIEYSTTFDYSYDNGGVHESKDVHLGYSDILNYPKPDRPGYEFGGWYTSADGTGIRVLADGSLDPASVGVQVDPSTAPYSSLVKDDTVLTSQPLYAYWIKSISGSSNSGSTGGTSIPGTAAGGTGTSESGSTDGSLTSESDGTVLVILEGMSDSEAQLIDGGEMNSTPVATADEEKTLTKPVKMAAAKAASFADVAEPAAIVEVTEAAENFETIENSKAVKAADEDVFEAEPKSETETHAEAVTTVDANDNADVETDTVYSETDTGKLGCRTESKDVTGLATVSTVPTEATGSDIDTLKATAAPAVLAVTEDERRRNAA